VALAVLLVFSPALWNGFAGDDIPFIVSNAALADLGNVPRFFFSNDALGTGLTNPYYRPLTTTSFAVDRFLWGEAPAGYHLTNILLHLAVCLLLIPVLRRLASPPAAGAAVLLFAVHPAHAEPVGYISARADLWSALFLVASFLAHQRHLEQGRRRWMAVSLLLFLPALLSKILALVFPGILLFHLLLVERRRDWGRFL
jgi:hypothetical protein